MSENNGFFGGTFGSSGSSSGGGGGNTIYTADDSLTGDRTVDLDGNILSFETNQVAGKLPPFFKVNELGDVELLANDANYALKIYDSITSGQINFSVLRDGVNKIVATPSGLDIGYFGGSGLKGTEHSATSFNVYANGSKEHDFYTANSVNNYVWFFRNGLTGSKKLYIGGLNINTTAHTHIHSGLAVKGNGTSTGSALAIYDNDTTPNKLWDFLDNGNVNLGVDSVLNINTKDLDINGSGLFSVSNGAKSISTSWNTHTTFNLNNGNGTTYSLYSGNASTTFNAGEFGIGVGSIIPIKIFNGSSVALGNVTKGNLDTNYNVQTNGSALIGGSLDTKSGVNEISLDHNNYPKLKISNGTQEYWLIEGDGTGSTFASGDLYLYDQTNSQKILQFKANGTINAPNLPTSATGLSSGDLWDNNGEVRIGTSTPTPVSSIYTADGTLTGNRTVDLDGNDLNFEGNSGLNIDNTSVNNSKALISLSKGMSNNSARSTYIEGLQSTETRNYWKIFLNGSYNFNQNNGIGFYKNNTLSQGTEYTQKGIYAVNHPLLISNYTDSTPRMMLYGGTTDVTGNGYLKFWNYNAGSLKIQIARSGKNFINPDAVGGISDAGFIVMGDTYLGTEKISLQGSTLIKGNGTSTGSALSIYDNDTTPNKLWDFLDNGNLNGSNNRITNTIVNPSVDENTTSGFVLVNADQKTMAVLTAMSGNASITAPTGTPVQGQNLIFRFKDDGTARALTWNAIFRAIGITLPTTTTANKLLYIGCKYNSTDTKWDVVSVQEEA